jgi:hypothetical protein
MNATVTYIGPLAEGIVQCPLTGVSYPRPRLCDNDDPNGKPVLRGTFRRGESFDLPENLAVNVASQSPNDWSVSPAVKKLAEAKSSITVIAAPSSETESANTDENTDEKV